MGAPQGSGPVTSTVVNIRSETVVPDHIVWSLFNTLFFNPFCLGFVAFAYSVKVGGCVRASPEGVREPPDIPLQDGPRGGEPLCVCVCPGHDEAAWGAWGWPFVPRTPRHSLLTNTRNSIPHTLKVPQNSLRKNRGAQDTLTPGGWEPAEGPGKTEDQP